MDRTNPNDENAIIRVEGLNNSFGSQVIHDNLDLKLRRGEILGVVIFLIIMFSAKMLLFLKQMKI